MSSMTDDLIKQGIRLKSFAIGGHKTTCPRCSHTRKDKRDPCLWVNIKDSNLALWKCHNCFWSGGAGDVASGAHQNREENTRREYKKPEAPKQQAASLPSKLLSYFESRGISQAVVERNRIYAEGDSICFPYFVNGELLNVKYRTIDKKFRMTTGAKLTFYGLDDCKDQEEIIIVEGEFDKLALEECGLKNVLSVPNGAPARLSDSDKNTGAFEYLAHSEELMKRAKKVLLAVDNDAAGKNLQLELSRRIGIEKIWLVKFPTKDANDCLKQFGIDITLDCIREAKPHPIKGLYRVDEFEDSLKDYFAHGMKSGVSTGWSNVDELYTVMPGELTVVTGVPNSGKSEWMDALLINLCKNEGHKFVIFSPEHRKEQHVTRLVEKIVGRPSSPKSDNRMTMEEYLDGAAWVAEHFYFIVADDEDSLPTLAWVMDKASQAVYRYGVNGLLIDPWNELEHQTPQGKTPGDYVGEALAKIKRWMRRHNICVWIVAHPTKIHADKDGKPRVAGLYDIYGSSNWANKTDNGIVIHRSDAAKFVTEVYLKKVRDKHVGQRGVCELRYELATGTYAVAKTKTSEARSLPPDEDDMIEYN